MLQRAFLTERPFVSTIGNGISLTTLRVWIGILD